jgi:hypothetical protein
MTLKVVTYEEDRLMFFKEQKKLAEKRYKRLEKLVKPDDSYLSEIRCLLSEASQELSFYNDVVEMLEERLSKEGKMVYFPFPIDCEKCPKATDIGVCEELDLLYNGEHPKYTRAQDWEFMCDTCPYEVQGRKYREEDDKDSIGKTMFFTKEEAETALKEGYSDDRIYRA